jgi:ornithine cyclodeaminase/alanine dehydrogenase-like protein (mu-crystallin family)
MSIPLAVIDAERTRDALPFARLIPVLRQAFAGGAKIPLRHHHTIPQPDGTSAVLLLMPAWQDQGYLGVKIVTIFPGNSARGLPGLDSSYLLCDGQTGRHLALIDGNQITVRRTVGVAALAASYLAREDATSLLLVGAGRVASLAAEAFRAVRPIRTVTIWNRDRAKAATLAEALRDRGFDAAVAPSLREAAANADIVCCATLSATPLIQADWLKPGTHLDLIGSFTPAMREADDACFVRGRVYVDSPDALAESGDLVDPIRNGTLSPTALAGTLAQLCAGAVAGRGTDDEITVFKAVGTALSDIAAGALVYRTLQRMD